MFGFTESETIPYLGIILFIGYVLVRNYRHGFRGFWSPLTILSIIFLYYIVLGPYYAIATDRTSDRLVNMRPYYADCLWGALVLMVSFAAGFWLNKKGPAAQAPVVSMDKVYTYGIRLSIVAIALFTLSIGGNIGNLINPLDAEAVTQTGGSLANYLSLSLNFMIAALTFLFIYYLRTKKGALWFFVLFLVTLGIFLSLGFRYRLVLLGGGLAITYYLNLERRPNFLLAFGSFMIFITLMGVINEGREYGTGIKAEKLETGDAESYFESGLNESRIFQTTGAIISIVPEKHPHVGFEPIRSTLLFPIPSVLYKEKNSAGYLFDALDAIYGRREVAQGSAFMAYGEYYLAFGWLGIVGGGMLLGWFYKRLWIWYLANSTNALAIALYSVTVSFMYVIMSRGYLPQVTMLFFFSVLPAFFVVWRLGKMQGAREAKLTPNAA
jgi:oligosaccharide repeat unit polymerase